eukprot:TRINITY_DN3825_c0_g1_i1.p1 TRINITY_DN3825_c0_g1~~TRINITY_DN3825_c0_g1_i1.p1  ORF type:complete len:509 (-),score=78.33 TRINITY_DN3825_c0_g1_i1:192-1718(-)
MLAMEFEETMGSLDKKIQSIKEEGKPLVNANLLSLSPSVTSSIPLTPETVSAYKHASLEAKPASSSDQSKHLGIPAHVQNTPTRAVSAAPLGGSRGSSMVVARKPVPPSPPVGLTDVVQPKQDHETKLEDIPYDLNGICKAMRRGAWKLSLKITDSLLNSDKLLPHERLQLSLCKILTLIKLRLYKNATDELEALGNLDDPHYSFEHFPDHYPGKLGSFMPFSMRVFQAELPALAGNVNLSMDLLHNLLLFCRKEIEKLAPNHIESPVGLNSRELDRLFNVPLTPETRKLVDMTTPDDVVHIMAPINNDLSMWRARENRVLFSIATRLIQQKEFVLAVVMIEDAIARYPDDPVLVSSLGRLHLQLGNIAGAKEVFDKVERMVPNSANSPLCRMNSGFLALATDRYDQGIHHFDAVLQVEPSNFTAANNKSICLLYTCNLAQAVSSLEDMLRQDPVHNLNETLVFNLCTMYDLQSDSSLDKKKALMKLVAKFGSDDFDPNVLRIPFEKT